MDINKVSPSIQVSSSTFLMYLEVDLKVFPLSEMTLAGIPCLVENCLKRLMKVTVFMSGTKCKLETYHKLL